MNLSQQLANHIRSAHTGGNYTGVNMQSLLSGITQLQATTKVHNFNTIAALVFHINYYAHAVLHALQTGVLDAHDSKSYDCPAINNEEAWQQLINQLFADAEALASLIEQWPESKWNEYFIDGKYGTLCRNIAGLIEHTHYHMGQIALIKKLVQ
ncbi:MAG: DinB family protein [Chitinophagaceae bacterium]|nr:DinB family protein [Chitinophagaceae bacterium]